MLLLFSSSLRLAHVAVIVHVAVSRRYFLLRLAHVAVIAHVAVSRRCFFLPSKDVASIIAGISMVGGVGKNRICGVARMQSSISVVGDIGQIRKWFRVAIEPEKLLAVVS